MKFLSLGRIVPDPADHEREIREAQEEQQRVRILLEELKLEARIYLSHWGRRATDRHSHS